jgi:hypothetical protein
MKKIIFIIGIIIFSHLNAKEKSFLEKQEFMDLQKANQVFGSNKVDLKKFISGDFRERGGQAAAICRDKSFIGKSVAEIRNILGKSDGYFWTDHIPAYIIGNGNLKDGSRWQIVFLINEDKKISEVKIHKNCCN